MTLHFGRGRGPGHLNRTPQAGSASPSYALNFLTGTLDPSITFTRTNATSTRVNASGALELVGANTARFDYSQTSIGTPLGFLVEEARTNLLLNSLLNGTSLSTQSVTVSATAYTLSFYGTGSIALSGTYTGTLNGSAVYPTRSTLTFTPTAGTLTLTVTGSVQYAQLEAGSFATSFIPTAGSTVQRSADTPSVTGTNFSSWFNPSVGSLYLEYDTMVPTIGTKQIVSLNGGSSTNRIHPNVTSGATTNLTIQAGGTLQASINNGTVAANTVSKTAIAYSNNDFAISTNGVTPTKSASGSVPSSVNQMMIGQFTGGNFLNGHIRTINYYPQRLPDYKLKALST